MKKSAIKLIIINTILVLILLLNSFIWSILNYQNMILLLIGSLLVFKTTLGFEKDGHRYILDTIINIIIFLLIFFIIYYILGIYVGFVRTIMHWSRYGLLNFILPFILITLLKEFLRYQILEKSSTSKFLVAYCFLVFTLMEISLNFSVDILVSKYDVFLLFATRVFPAISTNLACCYISKKVGYKPNIIWVLVLSLYSSLLPIIPDIGIYLSSMLKFLLPLCILYIVYNFFQVRKQEKITRYSERFKWIQLPLLIIFIVFTIYFTSGYFKYFTLAIATGSMTPNINKGDIVVVNKKFKYEDLKIGKVIAYKYQNKIVVHRLQKIDKNNDKYYYYTKGDANNSMDNYIVYYDTILGIVDYVVPYLGLPTVWLNEL